MFETGIGRSLNIQMAAFLPYAEAHDLSPSGRYFVEDVLENEIVMNNEGFIQVVEAKQAIVNEEIIKKYEKQRIVLKEKN